jgi:HEAT repeat protein
MSAWQDSIDRAIEKLRSTRQCSDGLVEVTAYGRSAVPALRALLFQREPSGLFQTRCRVIDALAAIKAYDVLIEYLNADHMAADPVERLGDDAVINYAAWAVARTREESVFKVLLRLARRPWLSGVIGALGAYGRPEALPALIDALEEDVSRNVAEFMLRRLGKTAVEALVGSANCRRPSPDRESESSRRRRRSSIKLLTQIGLRDTWPEVQSLMQDTDAEIAVSACRLCLTYAPFHERQSAVDRLNSLLRDADWILKSDIEACLMIAESPAKRRS